MTESVTSRRLTRAFAPAAALLALLAPGTARAARVFNLGFSSDPVLVTGTPASQAPWIARAVAEGAGTVRVNVVWPNVAPFVRTTGFDPTNPASYGYYWKPTDAAVRDLTAAGLRVVLMIYKAPTWAEAPGRPTGAYPGTWKPNVAQFAAFATAIAKRYSGHFPDPLNRGQFLPRVTYWQGWNEPELSHYITPQWTSTSSGFLPASPDLYRRMANAFYKSVKAVSKSNVVLLAGTAPYGEPVGGLGMYPLDFYRYLFCLSPKLHKVRHCAGAVHADIIDNHPYSFQGPTLHALNPGDVTIPDVYKIGRIVRAAVKAGTLLPRGSKPVWATEFSWDSNPPDPRGVPVMRQAQWLEQGLYLLWREGVNTALWFLISDEPPIPSYAASYQAGVFYINGTPKPAAVAFRFPLVTGRPDHAHVFVWGRAPSTGALTVQRLAGGQWHTLRVLSVKGNTVFTTTLMLRGKVTLRAQVNGLTSLPWTQGR